MALGPGRVVVAVEYMYVYTRVSDVHQQISSRPMERVEDNVNPIPASESLLSEIGTENKVKRESSQTR